MQLRIIITMLAAIMCLPGYGQTIPRLNASLTGNKITVSQILSDTAYMSLHPLTAFREMIRENAKEGLLKIVPATEPGKHILVKGILTDKSGKPLRTEIYFYQTSYKGWYAADAPHVLMNEGDRKHARIFGYLKTGSDGSFTFETIQPHGYPNSDLPAHIHFEVPAYSLVTELLFDDDERLAGEIRDRSIRENFLISKNSGTEKKPVYTYKVVTGK